MDLGGKAKQALGDYVPAIESRLASYFDEEISRDFGFNLRQKEMVRELLLHAKEHNLRPAKRLRGSFVNYGYMLSGKKVDERVWRAAMGVEVVHTGLLMHDDFMDRDKVRRGGPTTHRFFEEKFHDDEHLGASMAMTLGDLVLTMGIELVSGCDNSAATAQLLRGIVATGFGQAYDVSLEALGSWTEDDVITLHKAKTAVYTYENPLLVGAYLAGITDKKVLEILSAYAMDGGVAFQLQDDILGVFGTPEKTGKSADSDLLQGKCTLLVLRVLETGTTRQKKDLQKVWGKGAASRAQLEAAKRAIRESGSDDYSKIKAQEYASRAAATAARLREIKRLAPSAIDYIQGIAEYMVTREV